MLLRTLVPLLLCVSVCTCATLGGYQTARMEEGVHAADPGAASEALEPEIGSNFGSEAPADAHGVDGSASEEPEGGASATVGAGTAQGRPSGDAPPQRNKTADAPPKPPSPGKEGDGVPPPQARPPSRPPPQDESAWSLGAIRKRFQTVHGYFDSLVELAGGQNGVCQYRCRYGDLPQPRPGYQPSEPDGCSSSVMGFQLDLGIPAMTRCCDELDVCYGTCGANKYDCDSQFRRCLRGLCADINNSLGFASEVQACSSAADALYNAVWTLGCRSYMNSQRAACACGEEERDEL